MILSRIIAAIALVLLAMAPAQSAAEAISLDGETSVDSMGAHTLHLADPDAALTFADALHRLEAGAFQPIATTHFEAGYSMAPHWLATEVRNNARQDAIYRLLTNLPFAPAISVSSMAMTSCAERSQNSWPSVFSNQGTPCASTMARKSCCV